MTPDRFIAEAFREFVAETANVPIGHEDNQRGASTYNWRTSIAAKIAGRAAELARESVGVTDGPDVVAWIDGERIWTTHRAPSLGLHALVLARRSVGGDWLPIETAPKRTKVLVAYRNALGNWRRVIAKYYGENELPTDPDYSDDEFAEPGWYECVENAETISLTDAPPELWQPLPAPPLAGVSEGKE